MSQLRFPLRQYLEDPTTEAALRRIHERIEARTRGNQSRRPIVTWVLGGLATAAAAAVIVATLARSQGNAGPLLLADGREFVAVDAGSASQEVRLSDGSKIRLSAGARVEPLESSDTTFSAIVTQGSADFDVRPGGPRHWTVECGLATVEVIGTAFACEREPGWLRIVVHHGTVLVRGERVPHRAQRLSAGEILEVSEQAARPMGAGGMGDSADPVPAEATSAGAIGSEPGSVPKPHNGSRVRVTGLPTSDWQELARNGHQKEAFEMLGVNGLRRESARLGVNDLLALADVARLSGHPAEAVVPLRRIVEDFGGDPQAPLAAFALGRLELDSLGHPQAAATAFRKALTLGIPRSLREDVQARLVEAYAKSGDSPNARRAADAYLEEFPNGRHANAVRGWQSQR